MHKYHFLLLTAVILFASALRVYRLSDLPPSLNWDEVSLGYNAYSLLHTGADEWQQSLPLMFRAFGDYKLPGYVYFAVPSIAAGGINAFSVRLPSAMAGVGLVIGIYLLARRFVSANASLAAAMLMAADPWGLFLSHVAVEANLGTLFAVLGVCAFMYKRLPVSVILLGLSAWTYNTFRLVSPLLLAGLLLAFPSHWRGAGKGKWLAAIAACVLFIPMFTQLISPEGRARYQWLSLLDQGAINRINTLRGASSLPGPLPRLVFNKATYFSFMFAGNYIRHFSPAYLFLTGGSHYQFNIPGVGLMSFVSMILILAGIVSWRRLPLDLRRLLLIWLLSAPVSGSLTRDAPHALRSLILYPGLLLLAAAGAHSGLRFLARRGLTGAAGVVFVVAVFSGCIRYSANIPRYVTTYSWSWQYGHPRVVDVVKSRYADADSVVFTKRYGEPHEFVLFYWPWPPREFAADPRLDRNYHSAWYWVDGFAKFRFVNDWEMPSVVSKLPGNGRTIIVSSPDNPAPGKILDTVKFLDGTTAFLVSQF